MKLKMKYNLAVFFSLVFVFLSCKNDDQKRLAENKKETQKREAIFTNIQKGWVFYDTPVTEASENNMATWNEWRMFLAELAQKPKKILALFSKNQSRFQKK